MRKLTDLVQGTLDAHPNADARPGVRPVRSPFRKRRAEANSKAVRSVAIETQSA